MSREKPISSIPAAEMDNLAPEDRTEIRQQLRALQADLREIKRSQQCNSEPVLVDEAQLAKRYSVSTRLLKLWREQGRIPYVKIGRMVRYEVAKCDRIVIGLHTVKATE